MDKVREAAELIRDNMIGVARELADRGCGATQTEMREAQIEYLASVLGKEGNKAGGLWYRRWHRSQTALKEAVALLDECRENFALAAKVPVADPYMLMALTALCEQRGYGNVMASASALWRDKLDDLAGGEFVAGPCRSTVETQITRLDAFLASTHLATQKEPTP